MLRRCSGRGARFRRDALGSASRARCDRCARDCCHRDRAAVGISQGLRSTVPAKTPAIHLREQACQSKFISRAQTKEVSRMRRRIFVTSGLGLMAAAATQGLVGTFAGAGLRAQPAAAPMGPPQGKWIRLAPLPQATGELLGVAINGKVYAAQGLLPGFKPAGLVYEYDPARDAWTQKKPMPHPVHHAAVAALNGKMYLFGGFGLPSAGPPGWNPGNDSWEYDPATDSWQARAPMPTTRGGSVAALLNRKIYVICGVLPHADTRTPALRPPPPPLPPGPVGESHPTTQRSRVPP